MVGNDEWVAETLVLGRLDLSKKNWLFRMGEGRRVFRSGQNKTFRLLHQLLHELNLMVFCSVVKCLLKLTNAAKFPV